MGMHKLDPDTSAGRDLEVNRRAFDRLSEAIEEVKDKLTSAEFKELYDAALGVRTFRPRHRDEDETWAAIEGAVQAGGDFEMDWAAMYMNQVVEEDSSPNTERA